MAARLAARALPGPAAAPRLIRMGISAMLRVASVSVDPGREARCPVSIRNTGAVVDQFVCTVVGDSAGWASVQPEVVNLLPSEEIVVELVFAPVAGPAVLAGEYPFALRVISREDIAGSVVHEGSVTVTPFTEMAAEMVPKTSRGRLTGKHTVAVDNTGNHPVRVDVRGTDPDDRMRFIVRRASPVTIPGTATFVKVRAKPKKYFWTGQNVSMPFVVKVTPDAEDTITVEGAMVQRQLLPRRLLLLLSLFLLLLMLLFVFLATLLRLEPRSMARPAPLRPSVTATTARPTTPPRTSARATPPKTTARRTTASAGAGGGAPTPPSNALSFSIAATAFPGVTGAQQFSYKVPTGTNIRLGSVRLVATTRDAGTLQIRQGTVVLGTFDLARIYDSSIRDSRTGKLILHTLIAGFPTRPAVASGQLVTFSVTCRNTGRQCTPTGFFAATILR